MGNSSYRAAYLKPINSYGVCTLLTGPEHSGLEDDDLITEALAEARRGDIVDETENDADKAFPRMTLDEFYEQIEIGDWSE